VTAARLRPLNTPRKVLVQCDQKAHPSRVTIGRRELVVTAHHETWRIDDEWWRADPISRLYWRVSLDDGRTVDVYHDLVSGEWFRQSYG
jgi:hypothetical protein